MRLAFLALAFAGAVCAQEVPREDAAAIRRVISEQLEAFKRDDAPRAFALASAAIRMQFGSPEVFLRMVRTAYPVVYRPASVQFERLEMVEGGALQAVRMTDAEGRSWIAVYPMQRQPDGRWHIDGCRLARMPGSAT